MLDPALETEHETHLSPPVVAVADYAATFTLRGGPAIETARRCLVDALGRGLQALRDPGYASLIGPIVPGALMPGGARVPGTSLELEPAQAAFCISLMLGRPAGAGHRPAAGPVHPSESLGAILAVADYRARKAVMEGRTPPKVRDVLAAMVKALEIQSALASADAQLPSPPVASLLFARVAVTAVVAAQLGCARAQIVRAVGFACTDGETDIDPDNRNAIGRRAWARAETIGRAVRHACRAMTTGDPSPSAADDLEVMALAGRRIGPLPAGAALGTTAIERLTHLSEPEQAAQLTAEFHAALERCFPARQAERIKMLFAAPQRLDELPVNELLAALVTNGAR